MTVAIMTMTSPVERISLLSKLTLQFHLLNTAGGDQRVLESHNQMFIEAYLDKAGRGELLSSSSSQTAHLD
jgi:hypothetical protein